jgi:hypothetical protein
MVLWCHRDAARFSRPLLLSGRFPVPVLSVEVLFFGICFLSIEMAFGQCLRL